MNEPWRQQYYSAYVQAEAALRSAAVAVQQAQVAYETAGQAEASALFQGGVGGSGEREP